jgi:hypothetical protein
MAALSVKLNVGFLALNGRRPDGNDLLLTLHCRRHFDGLEIAK